MARPQDTRPEVVASATDLEQVARTLAEKLFGPAGPAWGTTFEDLEELVVQVGRTVSRELLRQALQKQAAGPVPADRQPCPGCQQSTPPTDPEPRILATRVGDAEWNEPAADCSRCRRTFFPSVGESGD
ncbi:hypothetical protein R5W24_004347 [Gemmata sp. JC717]|uniref:hypothetical protein n=1 Tax=Gemmata algarum TaxID=2975278 RepID=UPI0021BA3C24|nr:hypothetical protein [Gemmata algarum]MDY3555209.1 hypothetical protein [Gemmata algarum]